jgi:hypothetical protein
MVGFSINQRDWDERMSRESPAILSECGRIDERIGDIRSNVLLIQNVGGHLLRRARSQKGIFDIINITTFLTAVDESVLSLQTERTRAEFTTFALAQYPSFRPHAWRKQCIALCSEIFWMI